MKNRKFYAIQKADRAADLYIFGDIVPFVLFDGDVSAHSLEQQIKDLDVDEIRVHIDSYGGSVSEGWAIYNALRQHPAKVVTYGDGFVASAALYPFLAGDERIASNLSAYFLHQVIVSVDGNADDLRAAADEAEKMTEIGINAFVERTGMTADEVRTLMKVDTWLTPAQALDYGLATSITSDEALPIAQDAKRAVMQRVLQADKPAAPATVPPTNTAPVEPAPRQATLADQIKNMI